MELYFCASISEIYTDLLHHTALPVRTRGLIFLLQLSYNYSMSLDSEKRSYTVQGLQKAVTKSNSGTYTAQIKNNTNKKLLRVNEFRATFICLFMFAWSLTLTALSGAKNIPQKAIFTPYLIKNVHTSYAENYIFSMLYWLVGRYTCKYLHLSSVYSFTNFIRIWEQEVVGGKKLSFLRIPAPLFTDILVAFPNWICCK